MIKFVVNGKEAWSEQPADTPLLWVVRDELGLTGTKFGCGMELKSSATRCAVAPVPEEEKAYLSGFARNSATNSFALDAGKFGRVTSA